MDKYNYRNRNLVISQASVYLNEKVPGTETLPSDQQHHNSSESISLATNNRTNIKKTTLTVETHSESKSKLYAPVSHFD